MTSPGPTFAQPPRFNHVAVSLPADALDGDGRAAIAEFYGDVFGFAEYPQLTEDRRRLVLGLHTHEQFLFLVADDRPLTAPKGDHFGLSVSTLDEFREVARRAEAWHTRAPDEVELIAPTFEDHAGVLRLHSFYVRYRLPLMVETQHFEFLT
ncbi:MAG TPA: VOC family protein [Acidimicrobiales bacterium]|nr:VOC family protein [Acidimicrobiales bacterium]